MKIDSGLYISGIFILNYSHIRYCDLCFLNSDLNDLTSIKNIIGYDNRFLKKLMSYM